MASKLERIWDDDVHRSFIQSLDTQQSSALLRLLLVASGVDALMSGEERSALVKSLANLPAFHEAALKLELQDYDDDIDGLDAEYMHDNAGVLAEIASDLRDDSTRRHAFRTTVQFLQSDGLVPTEKEFVRQLGDVFAIEAEIVNFAIGA